jgi:hypothetical protein
MARMQAKYPGKCRSCGDPFQAGADIVYTRSAPKGRKTAHTACANTEIVSVSSIEAARGVGNGGGEVYEITTSGGTFYRNRNGICEDAPCCGCCTF